MSSVYENAAASITPPVQARNLYPLAVTASDKFVKVPDAWMGKYLTLSPRGGITVYFAFKYATSLAMTVDETAVCTEAANLITVLPANGADHVGDGGRVHVDLRRIGPERADPSLANSLRSPFVLFGWKGSNTGTLVVEVSDGPVPAP